MRGETATRPRIPAWVALADRALARASAATRMIARSTPTNLRAELDRLVSLWAAGREEPPCFTYEPRGNVAGADQLRKGLDVLASEVERDLPLGPLYAARARELADEIAVCSVTGPALWEAARRRFARRDAFEGEADALARQWLDEAEPNVARGDALVRSDDERDERSLLARLRQELGRRRLGVRVVVVRDLASLAATGDGVVQVVADRKLSRDDVERTVMHEIDGHVLPRHRASAHALGLFVVGTARGADDQEGRALALERSAGFLKSPRRRELAMRHLAARAVEARAEFVDTVRMLVAERAPAAQALRVAARAHRGGGLGREAVYMPALLRVEDALRRAPGLDVALGAGRVSVDAAPELTAWVG